MTEIDYPVYVGVRPYRTLQLALRRQSSPAVASAIRSLLELLLYKIQIEIVLDFSAFVCNASILLGEDLCFETRKYVQLR